MFHIFNLLIITELFCATLILANEEELRSEDEPTLENSLNVKKAENEIYPDTMKARRQATMHHQPMVQHANSKTRTNLHQEANRRGGRASRLVRSIILDNNGQEQYMNVDNGWYNHLEGGDVHAEEPWQREQNVGPAEETGYERKR